MNIKDFILGNIIWEIIAAVGLAIIGYIKLRTTGVKTPFELIKGLCKVNRVTEELIKVNRITRGGGLPKHCADRFIDIWLSSKAKPIKYGKCDFSPDTYKYIISFGGNRYYTWGSVTQIDDHLKKIGLVYIDVTNNDIKPIRNIINKIIFRKCVKILIKYHGDDVNFYRNKIV